MALKKYILFILIALFAFSPDVISSGGMTADYHYKTAKRKPLQKRKAKEF